MPTPILMPALSPTMEQGKLSKWLKKEGDKVASGDAIAEIETDKATMEVEAVDEGTIGKIMIPEGTEGVAVNTPIAVLLSEGEDAAALKGYGAEPAQPAPNMPPSRKLRRPRPIPSAQQREPRQAAETPARSEGEWPWPHFRIAAGSAARGAGRHRPFPASRIGSAWAHREA